MSERKINRFIGIGVLILGALLRVVVYIQSRNLALDEQSLALNICERDWTGLFCCLDYQQHFPPLSLVLIEWWTSLVGISDISLRFFPFLAGLIALVLFYEIVSDKLTYSWFPLLILSGSVFVLRYQTEFKQYSLDILASVLFLFFLTRPPDKWRAYRPALILFFLLSFWFSMPAIFLVAALWMYAFIKKLIPVKSLLFLGFGIASSFALLYLVNLDESVASDHLQAYHEQFFLQFPPGVPGQNFMIFLGFLGEWMGSTAFTIGAFFLLFFLGLVDRKHCWSVAAILLVFLLTGIASLGHFYSLIPRLLLFWAPLLLWITALGFDRTMGFFKVSRIPSAASWALAFTLFVFPLNFYRQGWSYLLTDFEVDRPLEVMQQIERKMEPGDVLWVSQYGTRVVQYYGACTGQSSLHQQKVRYFDHAFSQDSIIQSLEISSEKRIWILDTHDSEQFLNHLGQRFTVQEKITAGPSGALLIEKK
ncbi:MAG TPA: glycosyltransferase family 39 protein [Saprospiraceae bacterium]|nr:glycosyltransferase family 39 protein [Saprospiraceae bacterium]